MRKYKTTIDCFSVIEDDILTPELSDEREIYWISYYDSFKNGYNSTLGGNGHFQQSGENHWRSKMDDEALKELREIRASKIYTFSQVYEFYSDIMSYSGLEKLWNYESRPEIASELNTEELSKFYKSDHRQRQGQLHGNSKLTDEQVIEIRNRYFVLGETTNEIYKDFKDLYSLSGFRKVILGQTYSHLPIPEKSEKCKKKKEKLSKEDVLLIRKLYNEDKLKIMEIIRNYFPDRSESTISNVVYYRTYKNI